ncbi:hypothetical protein JCM3775_006572 [Rhodotorula graminis]
MSSRPVKSEGDAEGALSLQLDSLTIELAASLHRLDPSGQLRPIWNMLKNPSTCGHGYWDLLGMEQRVYEQHPPQTPGVVTASSATRERRRDHGLLLEGRLSELLNLGIPCHLSTQTHEIDVLERKLRALEPTPVNDKFVPVARPQTLLPLRVLQGRYRDDEPGSHALSMGRVPELGWRAAGRYRLSAVGRAPRC